MLKCRQCGHYDFKCDCSSFVGHMPNVDPKLITEIAIEANRLGLLGVKLNAVSVERNPNKNTGIVRLEFEPNEKTHLEFNVV